MAVNYCNSLISAHISFTCDQIGVRGVESDGMIINRDDVDFANCVISDNIITTLALKSSTYGYAIQQLGNTPFTGTKTELNIGTYVNTFNNTVQFVVLNNGTTVCKNIIDGLANGTYVVILKNKYKGTGEDSKYQVYGWYQGLKASAIENDKWSEETEGGWLVTLVEERTTKSGLFYFDTDEDTTDTAYESLLAS